jgi:hypothetical protein
MVNLQVFYFTMVYLMHKFRICIQMRRGKLGIIRLIETEAARYSYQFTYKLKIRADLRIYSNRLDNGHFYFTKPDWPH